MRISRERPYSTLASGDYNKTVSLWNGASGECLSTFQGHGSEHVYSVAWSADGNKLASACSDSTVRIWNVSTGTCEQVIQGKNHGWGVDWHPVNDLLAIAFMEQPNQEPRRKRTVYGSRFAPESQIRIASPGASPQSGGEYVPYSIQIGICKWAKQ